MDQAGLENRLTEILARVLGEGTGPSAPRTPMELKPTEDFAILGVNSVDLMEFLLRVEKEFNVDVLEKMLPDELPSTLRGWAQVLYPRIQRSTAT